MNSASVLIYHLDSVLYALPLAHVERVTRAVEITAVTDLANASHILGVINVHGRIVPVVNTRRMLGLSERELSIDDVFIIVHANAREVALVVDGVDQIVALDDARLTQAHTVLPECPQVQGIARVTDSLVLMHDLQACLNTIDAAAFDTALQQAAHAEGA